MSARISIEPIFLVGQACSGVYEEAFFPETRKFSERRPAIRLCQACPVLGQCAAYAAQLVESRAISGCVIASVYVPNVADLARGAKERAVAVAQLKAIAADAPATGEVAA
ncbi:WhiB family transcriptional regulator [Nocardia alba]|uniref:Transcription factor WhiB n=1 Tax=Nocardia alba TaxID=225051 RepID=A0A4R1F408_9NOCA|nr:WhiB family transcriptional regulator [Nocardia alba]TCJ88110.1 transcription factor WhiB [Nocardia alba]